MKSELCYQLPTAGRVGLSRACLRGPLPDPALSDPPGEHPPGEPVLLLALGRADASSSASSSASRRVAAARVIGRRPGSLESTAAD